MVDVQGWEYNLPSTRTSLRKLLDEQVRQFLADSEVVVLRSCGETAIRWCNHRREVCVNDTIPRFCSLLLTRWVTTCLAAYACPSISL